MLTAAVNPAACVLHQVIAKARPVDLAPLIKREQHGGHASDGSLRSEQGQRIDLHAASAGPGGSDRCRVQPKFTALAIPKAAAAASPPTVTVCHALLQGRAVVNCPLM